MDQEAVVMEIIVNAGEARSLCFEALAMAKKQELEQARDLLKQARSV